VYYSSRIVSFLYWLCSCGQQSLLQEKKAQRTLNINSPSVDLDHETAFQFQDIICPFLEQFTFKAYRSEVTPSDSLCILVIQCSWEAHHMPHPLFTKTTAFKSLSLHLRLKQSMEAFSQNRLTASLARWICQEFLGSL